MQAPDPSHWTIADHPAADRFVMSFPGGEAFAVYRRLDDYLVVSHTEVPAGFRGRGIGERLVLGVFRLARERGQRLGLRLLQSSEHSADYGVASILFSVETPSDGRPATRGNGTHVAFAAGRRELVEMFHRTALAHGGRDGGAPGLRPEYDAHDFGAFVFDPDRNKIEAVTRSSQ